MAGLPMSLQTVIARALHEADTLFLKVLNDERRMLTNEERSAAIVRSIAADPEMVEALAGAIGQGMDIDEHEEYWTTPRNFAESILAALTSESA